MNVFMYKTALVAPLKEDKDSVTFITSAGETLVLPQAEAIVERARLMPAGIYNEKFIQAAVGGLKRAPSYVAKTGGVMLYDGLQAKAFVEPMGKGLAKFAMGVDDGAFVTPPNKNNKGTLPDPTRDNVLKEDGRKDNGAAPMDQIDDLDNLGETPDELPIADGSKLEGVEMISMKWVRPEINGSLQDLTDFFGRDDSPIGIPDTMTVDTGNERFTKKKKTPNSAAKGNAIDAAIDAAAANIKKGQVAFGMNPTMSHSCSKCQAMNLYEYDAENQVTKTVCSVCGYQEKYERNEALQDVTPGANEKKEDKKEK